MLLTFNILFVLLNIGLAKSEPKVTIHQGSLIGKYRTSRLNRTFSSFEGIPFAQPPLGELRFKAPVPAESWNGIRDATQVHNVCPQRDIYRRTSLVEGDEDCLYLNVYTPQLLENELSSLPVLIFLHGGGWLCGGGNSKWYGPETLLDHDVILVVTNYRLGALGFLSTGDETCPGNNGLKDQNLAIKWVKENINKFGGDPDQITLFGESAGGVSVHLHMLSPLSRDLFQRGISQSGTAFCTWALSTRETAVNTTKLLGTQFGCDTENSAELIKCLRNIPANDLVTKDKVFMKWDTDPMIPFKPVIEDKRPGAFLVEHPVKTYESGNFNQAPWIVGLNEGDGALRAAGLVANSHLLEELDKDFNTLVPMSLEYEEYTDQIEDVTKKIREFYFGDRKLDESVKNELVDMYTDGWFLYGQDKAIKYHLKYNSQPVYNYLFAHRGAASFTEIFGDKVRDYGVCHADELQYLFPLGADLFPDKPPTADDLNIASIITKLWTNFAKTGNPTPSTDENIKNLWMPVKNYYDMNYFDLRVNELSMKKKLLKERSNFWRNLPLDGSKYTRIKDEL